MTHWRLGPWRGVERPGALRAGLRVEGPEQRTLRTSGLQIVPGTFINNSTFNETAAIADNDIWAVGDIGGNSAARVTLAEHFNDRAGALSRLAPSEAATSPASPQWPATMCGRRRSGYRQRHID